MENPSGRAPRILFFARSCDIAGMFAQLVARSESYFCGDAGRAPAGMRLFRLRDAWKLRRALREGKYDLVISCSNSDPIWRENRSRLSNALKFLRKLVFKPSTLGFEVVPWIMGDSKVPLAVFDWDDTTMLARKNWSLLQRATCYFKKELSQNPYKSFLFQDRRNDCLFNIVRQPIYDEWVKKLRPISVGITPPENWAALSAVEKKTDVFFAGAGHYSWARREGLRQLEELRAEGYRIDLYITGPGKPGFPRDEFLRRCAEAWLVWSPEGAGWDCMRHYWAPLTGSVPLLNHPDTRRHAPLLDGVHALYYGVEGDGLKRMVRFALKDKPRLNAMAAEARAFVLSRHTHPVLADHLIAETLRTAAEVSAPAR